jgi:hypothetical protein
MTLESCAIRWCGSTRTTSRKAWVGLKPDLRQSGLPSGHAKGKFHTRCAPTQRKTSKPTRVESTATLNTPSFTWFWRWSEGKASPPMNSQ